MRASGEVVMFRWWEEFDATPDTVAERAVKVATDHVVTTLEGTELRIDAETVCVHSDTPGAAELGRSVRTRLDDSGVPVHAPSPA